MCDDLMAFVPGIRAELDQIYGDKSLLFRKDIREIVEFAALLEKKYPTEPEVIILGRMIDRLIMYRVEAQRYVSIRKLEAQRITA
jgi:hypothetical protein